MEYFLQKKGFITSVFVFLVFVLCITIFYENFWNEDKIKDLFFQISAGYFLLIVSTWVFFNKTMLFNKSWIRNVMIIVASCILVLWTYKHKITFRFDIIFVFFGFLYVILYRKFIKPNAIIISFLVFILWKMIGLLWSPDIAYAWEIIGFDITILTIIVCILSFGFRATPKETNAFIVISFKLLLGLMVINIAIYYLYISVLDKSFFSFFTFNKQYLPYYEVLRWSHYKHPSLITWLLLLVGGLGFLVHKENKKLISLSEIILYAILLFFLMFIIQARVTILGYILSVSFFFWLYISKGWSLRNKILIVVSAIILGISSIAFLVQNTTYFSDPIRIRMYQKGFEKIKENPIFGNGTIAQALLEKDLWHLHNDFLATWVDLGIIGVFMLIGLLFSIFYIGIRTSNNKIVYAICVYLLVMNTDVVLYDDGYSAKTILIPLLIYVFFASSKSKTDLLVEKI